MRPRVLLIDDDPVFIEDLMHHSGDRFDWQTEASGAAAIEAISACMPDVVLLDIGLREGPEYGFVILSRIRDELPRIPVIMVTGADARRNAAKAWRLGAFGYVEKGSRIDELGAQIERAVEEATLWRENDMRREEITQNMGRLVGQSPVMRQLIEQVERVARVPSTALITGESGTGKELVAREIHERSPRGRRLFVAVNCPTISKDLVESSLFGHEKGAFTGAEKRTIGLFEAASGGTIFLDEVSEMGLEMQAKLLRVLQEQCLTRVGSTTEIPIDVRVIAASNRDLEAMVAAGEFRDDLYYRLSVVPIAVPPLRERKADIPLLAQAILDRKAGRMNRGRCGLGPAVLDRLLAWDWPGNVRELENILERALVYSSSDVLGEDLFADLGGPGMARLTFKEAKMRALERFERDYVTLMLRDCGGNQSEVARRSDLSREGLRKIMKRLGIASGSGESFGD